MIVNFRTRVISRGAHKLARTPMLNKKTKKKKITKNLNGIFIVHKALLFLLYFTINLVFTNFLCFQVGPPLISLRLHYFLNQI